MIGVIIGTSRIIMKCRIAKAAFGTIPSTAMNLPRMLDLRLDGRLISPSP